MNEPDELDRLIDGYLDATLTDAELSAFNRRIASDPKAAKRLAQALRFHADLRDYAREASNELWDTAVVSAETVEQMKAQPVEASPVTSHQRLRVVKKSHRATRRLRPEQDFWTPVIAAAALLLLTVILWSVVKSPRGTTPPKVLVSNPIKEHVEIPAPRVPLEKVNPSSEKTSPLVSAPEKTPEALPLAEEPDVMAEVRRESLARIEAERRKMAEQVAAQTPVAPALPDPVKTTEPRGIVEVLLVSTPVGSGENVPVVVRGSYEHSTRTPLKQGVKLNVEDIVETGLGQVTLGYPGETTRIELKPKSMVRLFEKSGDEKSKRLSLEHGEIFAQVDKQLPGKPMLLVTPHAEAMVLGTQFSLAVNRDATRLNVTEGKVRMTRLADRSVVDVARGESATATALNAQGLALFNGKDLNDWIVTRGKWFMEDGLAVGQDPDGGSSRIESKASFKNYELSAKVRVTNTKLAEVQVRTYAYFFQLQWDQPGQWTDVKVIVRGEEMSATQDGKMISREDGDGDAKKQSGPIGFFVSRGGRMELKDVKLRELP